MISKRSAEELKDQSIDPAVGGDDLQFVREKYKSIFESRLHCIYAHDLAGNFLEANDAALKLLGYRREELLLLNLSELIEEDKLALALKTAEEILRTGFRDSEDRVPAGFFRV